MIQILEFTFQSFWHFIGVWLLMAAAFVGLANVVRSFRTVGVPGPRGDMGPPGPQGITGADGVCRCNDVKH